MIETLHSEQLTNPDFQLWEREAQVNLGELTLSAVSIEYGGGGGSTGNFAEAFNTTGGDTKQGGGSGTGGGNTGNIIGLYALGGEGGGNTGN